MDPPEPEEAGAADPSSDVVVVDPPEPEAGACAVDPPPLEPEEAGAEVVDAPSGGGAADSPGSSVDAVGAWSSASPPESPPSGAVDCDWPVWSPLGLGWGPAVCGDA